MTTISGVLTFRNCIKTGYPFLEAILSVLPIVDEYRINDGGSIDGTKEWLQKLKDVFPDKIILYDMQDYPSDRWECVSEQYNKMIEDSTGDWMFQGDADEVIHEQDIGALKAVIENISDDVDVLRFPRREIGGWMRLSGADKPYHPCRAVRNIPGLYQKWESHGGDEFLDEAGWIKEPRRQKSDVMIWHLYTVFPGNNMEKWKNDATYVATGDDHRVRIFEERKNKRWSSGIDRVIVNPIPNLPALVKDMVGWDKYKVRGTLLDIDWLNFVTGLRYG